MAQSLLRKALQKTHNSTFIPTITSRFFTAQNWTSNPEPFPDKPSSAYYDKLINSAGSSRDFETVGHLLNKRFSDGFFTSNNTFKFITNKESSISMLDELSQSLARLHESTSRKGSYDSLIARLSKIDLIDESLRLIETMAREGYGLNACSFYPILRALTKKEMLGKAWSVVDLMKKLGVPPDPTVYNYFLAVYCFSGDMQAAAGVLEKIEEEGMRADSRTYDALVMGASKAGKVDGALVLMRRMEEDGVPVMFSTRVYVLEALLGFGYYDQAVEFVMCYSERDTWVDEESFGWLANRFIKLKRFDEAKLMLEEMDKRGLVMGDKLKDYYKTKCN